MANRGLLGGLNTRPALPPLSQTDGALLASTPSGSGTAWAESVSQFIHVSGNWYTTPIGRPVGTIQGNNDRLFFVPLVMSRTCEIDQIAVVLTTVGTAGGGGPNLRLGLYTSNTAGKPDRLIVDAGEMDVTATTGVRAITINATMRAHTVYWAAMIHQLQGTKPTLRSWDNTSGDHDSAGLTLGIVDSSNIGVPRYDQTGWYVASWTYGPLPYIAPTSVDKSYGTTPYGMPVVGVRVP